MAHTNSWNVDRLPRQEGKVFVVTGATGGIGYFIAEQLAAAGAHVILAARSEGKADPAVLAVRAQVPEARLTTVRLTLATWTPYDRPPTSSAGSRVSTAPC